MACRDDVLSRIVMTKRKGNLGRTCPLLNFLFVGMRSIPILYWILLIFGIPRCPRIVAELPDAGGAKSKSSLLIPAAVAIGVATGTVTASVTATTEPHKRKFPKRRSKALSRRWKTSTSNHAATRAALNLESTAIFQEINQATRPVSSVKPQSSPRGG